MRQLSAARRKSDAECFLLIAALVFLTRYLTRGALYFIDGPRIVAAIQDHTYVIQPPGYWLYAHLGAIFHNPASGLSFSNQVFSAVGASVFFLLCRKFNLPAKTALLSALAYSSIFFVWFAGDVQSSYASQILFAPLTVYCFLHYRDRPSVLRLLACATSFALGSGLRPSDGVFLGPLFVFMLFQFVPRWRPRILLILSTGILCLLWYLPTQLALRAAHRIDLPSQLGSLAFQVSPLLGGINRRTTANVLRVALPLFTAFWMLIPAVDLRRNAIKSWIPLLWIGPGLAFLVLIYMADAPYLTFLAGGVVLCAALSARQRLVNSLLLACLIFNTLLFLGARPLKGSSHADLAINFYIVKYCDYGIRHQWNSSIGQEILPRSRAAAITDRRSPADF